jgi:hypothetical protein
VSVLRRETCSFNPKTGDEYSRFYTGYRTELRAGCIYQRVGDWVLAALLSLCIYLIPTSHSTVHRRELGDYLLLHGANECAKNAAGLTPIAQMAAWDEERR